MLENAKVLISLEDLDELRLKEKHYLQLIREISNCVMFDFDEYAKELKRIDKFGNDFTNEELDEAEEIARSFAKIIVNTKQLEKILVNNCCLNKTENEVELYETLADPAITYNICQEEKQ